MLSGTNLTDSEKLSAQAKAADGTTIDERLQALLSEKLDIVFCPPSRAGQISSWWGHVPFAHWLVAAVRPRTVVELGTHHGVSYAAFCEAILRQGIDARCIAVDTWQGDEHAGIYSEEVYEELRRFHDPRYGAFSELLRYSFDDALSHIPNGSIDLLHIDGLHKYEAVKHDFESWLPKLSERAVVLFHDTNERDREFGVWRLWEELAKQYPHFEFLHGHGLGILAVGPEVPQPVFTICNLASKQISDLRQRFSELGARWIEADRTNRANEHANRLSETILSLRSTVAELKEELAGTAALKEELTTYSESARSKEKDLNELNSRILSLQAEKAQLRQRLQAIEGSTTWRTTAPVRAALTRIPPTLRRHLRRAIKGIWWGMTPRRWPALRHALTRHASSNILGLQSTHSAFLGFSPGQLISNQTQSTRALQRYYLSDRFEGYTYIPPRRPDDIEGKISSFSPAIRFSIVVPVYNTPIDLMDRLLASVEAQWYPHWELILVDDNSANAETKTYLRNLHDSRMRTIFCTENKGISGATNVGLEHASGNYVVFLDHDDELTEDCLFELASCIDKQDPDYIYSDEDKIAPDGKFVEPFFKPDWSPDTLMSTMYTCHVSCVRKALLDEVGYLRPEYDGCQDWDLILRLTEKTNRIAHVPKVLYHWRIIPNSIAADLNAKPYAIDAGRRVRVAALERRGLTGEVEPAAELPGYHRVKYALRGSPLISIIIPSKDNGPVLERCLNSIATKSTYRNFEITILDNGSTDNETIKFLETLRREANVSVISDGREFNYSALNNIGVQHSSGELLLFLNDDTEVISEDWLERMGGYAQLSHVGAVGAKLLYPEGRKVQHNGIVNLADGPGHAFLNAHANDPGYFARNLLEYNWIAVTGACLMIERSKYESVGCFDENFPIAYNDVDLCFRLLKSGYFNIVSSSAELIHYESLSRGIDHLSATKLERLNSERARLYRKHPEYFMHDPFFSPNLHPNDPQFGLPNV